MDAQIAAVLLRDFSPSEVGHKPAPWCKTCNEIVRKRIGKSCGDHEVVFCKKCRTTLTEAHACLDFVGHADVRHRLCEADPDWGWEPYDFPVTGPLVITDGSPVGLWIRLTVGGVSKLGYGSCDKGKAEAMKELIGDAIRNAGQSFGIAWKMWAKSERGQSASAGKAGQDRDTESFENAAPAPPRSTAPPRKPQAQQSTPPAEAPAATPPEAPAAGEPDPDAQQYADEASQCRTTAALRDVNGRARDARKLSSLIRNPSTSGTGGLGQYIGWLRRQLEDAESALKQLQDAADAAGVPWADLDDRVKQVTRSDIEGATPAQLRETALALARVKVPA